MTDAERIHASVAEALQRLGAKHGIDASQAPAPRQERPYTPRERYTLPERAPSAPPRGREAVTREQRALEGLYADVVFRGEGAVTVLIHSVEARSTGVKAYVMRLDKRTREYIELDRLHSLRDAE